MSGCRKFEGAIDLHAAGGLEGPEREALVSHLAGCPGCAAELEATRQLLAEVAGATPALSPERVAGFAARVRAAAERQASPGARGSRGPGLRWQVRWTRLLAGAGAVAAAAALVLFLRIPDDAGGARLAPGAEAALPPLSGTLAAALAEDLAAAGDDAFDLLPEDDLGLDALTDDELLAMERLLAAYGG